MLDNTPTINKVAFGLLILAKFCGLLGVGAGFAGFRLLGGSLLAVDGLLIFAIVIMMLFQMKKQNEEDQNDKDTLNKMLQDGTLFEKLREIGLKAER